MDENKIGQYTGEPIGRADPEFVRTVTGFAIGGVPPVGHAQPLDTYIDEDLLQYSDVWAAAGTPNAVFPIALFRPCENHRRKNSAGQTIISFHRKLGPSNYYLLE